MPLRRVGKVRHVNTERSEDKNLMSSIETQFLSIKAHHSQYPAVDPKTALKGSASGKIIFITGASQGIGQATAVAFCSSGC